ncbi:MAG: FAD-dependent oxidoreductase, partial [Rhodospirillaceae bacterium]|nr:FAD-dependent oxidoreductase [Rhodospirillaceae bacterium]
AVHEGTGKLAGKGKLIVTQGDKTVELQAKNIIVATGARARELPFAKADGKRVWTYRHALVPEEMPTKLLVIGSGAIGIEFASFYSDMGAEVTVVEMLDRILPVEDEEVSAFVHKALTKQGMKIHTATGVQKLEAGAKGVKAEIKAADGKIESGEYSHAIV